MTGGTVDVKWQVGPMIVSPSEVDVFCFSAATWNPHRLHYDVAYCLDVEGQPGVVVPGQMQGAWLLELVDGFARERGAEVQRLEYKNVHPAYVGDRLTLAGTATPGDGVIELEVAIENSDGVATCQGRATLRGGSGAE